MSKSTNLNDTINSQTQSENAIIGKLHREQAILMEAIKKSKNLYVSKEVDSIRRPFPQVKEPVVEPSHMILNAYQPNSAILKKKLQQNSRILNDHKQNVMTAGEHMQMFNLPHHPITKGEQKISSNNISPINVQSVQLLDNKMFYTIIGSAGQNAGSAFSHVDMDSFDRRERIDNNEAFCYKYIPQSEIRSNGRKLGAIPRIPSKRTTSSR